MRFQKVAQIWPNSVFKTDAVSAKRSILAWFSIENGCGFSTNPMFWSESVLELWYLPALVRVGPRFPFNFGPDPSWSEILWKYLVPVRVGPRFSKNIWSWSELVPGFLKIFGPGPAWSWISEFFPVLVRFGPRTGPNRSVRDRSVLVRGSLGWVSHDLPIRVFGSIRWFLHSLLKFRIESGVRESLHGL